MKLQLYNSLKPSIVNQKFGVNEGANYQQLLGFKGHPGTDFTNIQNGINESFGLPIRAAHDGTVIQLEQDQMSNYSPDWTVVLATDKMYDYGDGQTYFKTVYAHCTPNSFSVKKGDKVKTGDVLALCGASGITPPPDNPIHAHLHFGLKPATFHAATAESFEWWENTYQNNGYGGAVDDAPYQTGVYAEDFAAESEVVSSTASIVQEISVSNDPPSRKLNWLQAIINALKSLFQ